MSFRKFSLVEIFRSAIKILIIAGVMASPAKAQSAQTEAIRQNALKVYVKCDTWCPLDYFKTKTEFVNFVREREVADVVVLITSVSKPTGGEKYVFEFTGKGKFENIHFQLEYDTYPTTTLDEKQDGMLKTFQMGLLPFVSATPPANYLHITYHPPGSRQTARQVKDRWNHWTFSISSNLWTNGDANSSQLSSYNSLTIKRTTEENKFRMHSYFSYGRSRYTYGDINTISTRKSYGGELYYAFALAEHWSAGGEVGVWSSKYSNVELGFYLKPAIEYSFFPYEDFNKRELVFQLWIGPDYFRYYETTIYDKIKEFTGSVGASGSYSVSTEWGSIEFGAEYSAYLHDLSKDKLSLDGDISIKILGGLSFELKGGYSFIHNQINLARGEASDEEVYLNIRELETSYSYWGSVGLSYTFGSIYTNIVNPRLNL